MSVRRLLPFLGLAMTAMKAPAAALAVPAPGAPAHLVATPLTPTEVKLAWKDRTADAMEVRVELRTVDGEFADIGGLPAGSATALVEGLRPATAYAFRVRALRSGRPLAHSNPAAPLPPAGRRP